MSFHVYDNASRPIDALADADLAPDAGSANPFYRGADRTATARRYTAFVDSGAPPATGVRARNTLYGGGGQNGLPNPQGLLIYRVYIPDAGHDDVGGTGLPRLTLETTDTASESGPTPCDGVTRPSAPDLNKDIAALAGPPPPYPGSWPGYDPPMWRKTKNLPNSYAAILLSNPYGEDVRTIYSSTPADGVGGAGAFFGNLHNNYMATLINRGYGQVLAFRMRVPTFPDTRGGAATMADSQLRYFSICQNEIASTRYVACTTDDRTTTVADPADPAQGTRWMTFVVSTSDQRPATATAACGVNWIPWGPAREGVIIYRHMLPAPSFAQAIQRIPLQGQELQTLGDYHPRAKYFPDRAAFEALGCATAAYPPGMSTGPGQDAY
jgi:hypothetical protein